ncbi:unnamed protein product [Arabidopsis arenosa]|uniref:Cysteinyl-tRNA synthetase n=1 Tax=Arabidopsis arenosa TaxID=38785 RepID=A0A8S2AFS0_ARAAE|nr:unnamed protein product [Arabidopsis arenosa]
MQEKQRMSMLVSLLEVEKAVREVLDLLAKAKMGEEEILQKIEERRIARKNKDFDRSDEIRNTLALAGISLMDIPGKNSVWRPCIPQSQSDSAKVDATQQSTPP